LIEAVIAITQDESCINTGDVHIVTFTAKVATAAGEERNKFVFLLDGKERFDIEDTRQFVVVYLNPDEDCPIVNALLLYSYFYTIHNWFLKQSIARRKHFLHITSLT
jgi:hypothetical protein